MSQTKRFVSKVTSKGQVTIPKEIRARYGLDAGSVVVWKATPSRVVLERPPVPPTENFEKLAARIAQRFSAKGITRSDVEDAIKWARDTS